MNQIKEAIELLEEAKRRYSDSINRFIDQALTILRPLAEEPPQGEFTKKLRQYVKKTEEENLPISSLPIVQACDIIDRQATELKDKDEKFNILANHVVDMSHAIIGWREAVAFDSEDDLVGELERMVGEALELVPKF